MRSIECEGETIDEAIARALETLQLPRERVEVEILTNASPGLFGLGGRKARVRATVREALRVAVTDDGGLPDATEDVSRDTIPSQDAGDLVLRAREVLEQLLGHLGASCTVEATETGPEGIVLHLRGPGSGLVIGRRGQTLDAVNYLLNRIVRRPGGDPRPLVVDVEGYRQRREESLVDLARRLATKAKETGRVVTLNPMSPRDRRIVHLALGEDGAVTTRSQGTGHYRKLLILPQRGSRHTPPGAEGR